MVVKSKDPVEPALAELERLLAEKSLNPQQRSRIEEEKRNLRAGNAGEHDAAYYIDFELGPSFNYAVLHDLRIEHGERVAQIDHLIIGRMLDIILIESKNFSTPLRINSHGEFEVKTRRGWQGMESPVEQNRRHALALSALLKTSGLLPKRLGVQITPDFHNWILVAPECVLDSNREDTEIIKRDMFGARMKEWYNESGDLWKVVKAVSPDTLREFAVSLAAQHRPITFDYAAKFGIAQSHAHNAGDAGSAPPVQPAQTRVAETPQPQSSTEKCCDACNAPLDAKVVTFCRLNAKRFAGRVLCRRCQVTVKAPAICASCAVPVDGNVVAFCRFNSRRFEKRVLCRNCQSRAPVLAATTA